MVPALRKKPKGGEKPYTRRAHVEALLSRMQSLGRDEVVARAQVVDTADPRYLPHECVLHFARQFQRKDPSGQFERLFRVLYQRLIRALPRVASGEGAKVDRTAERVRDHALDRFFDMLATDRESYDERLDYFEVSFNAGLANLRKDAMALALRESRRSVPIEYDAETGAPSAEVERARGSFDPFDPATWNDEDYRMRLDAAIDSLPEEQIRIITMIANDIPIESKLPGRSSISAILGRSEKTIRLHRDRAYESIRSAMWGDGI